MNEFDKIESTLPSSTHYCSTEALVNELQTIPVTIEAIPERKITFEEGEDVNSTARTSPRVQLLIQQHLSNKKNVPSKMSSSTEDNLASNSETKSKTFDRQPSNSTLNCAEPSFSMFQGTTQTQNKLQRPKTATITRNQTSVNAVGAPSRLSSAKMAPTPSPKKTRKKSATINRPKSASVVVKSQQQQQQAPTLISDASSYSQTLYAGRPLSAALQNHQRHPPLQRTIDSSCSIREAKGPTSRYNKPEELFGIKPEDLFGLQNYQPKIIDNHKSNDHARLKRYNMHRQQHVWQEDVHKLVDLFNIHHSSNYRPSAKPPPPVVVEEDTITDLTPTVRFRRLSISKNPLNNSRSSLNPKHSTFAALNIPRRNSISHRTAIKVANT